MMKEISQMIRKLNIPRQPTRPLSEGIGEVIPIDVACNHAPALFTKTADFLVLIFS
jgi:hypothetical protein